MGISDSAAYRAGKTAYADVGALYRASFDRVANADPPLGPVAWRVWSAVMVATVSRSKLLDRTSLNALGDAAGIRRKGGGSAGRGRGEMTPERAQAKAVAAALEELSRIGAITYGKARAGRPAVGEYRPVTVGLPDPTEMGVSLAPITPGKWGSAPREMGVSDALEMGVSKTPLTEKKQLPRRDTESGRRNGRSPHSRSEAATGRKAGEWKLEY